MKAIREKSTNRILYTGVVELTPAGVVGDGFIDPRATPGVVEEIELPDVPNYFRAGECSFANGVWAIVEQTINSDLAKTLQAEIVTATQQRLDDFARTRNYDGILSLCTYATSANPKFKQEGLYGVEVRDSTWAKLYEILAEVESGVRPIPSGYAEIEPELPQLAWPN